MISALDVAAVVVAALRTGNEVAIAAFVHPGLMGRRYAVRWGLINGVSVTVSQG